jgi:Flp pilus assembly protein TadG
MVTAELATALPVLVLLLLISIAAVGVAQARVRCADAAREAARAIARGDASQADALAHRTAGSSARVVQRSAENGAVAVTVQLSVPSLPGLPPVTVAETAATAIEPGAEPGAQS